MIRYCGWRKDYPLRLFNRKYGNFNDSIGCQLRSTDSIGRNLVTVFLSSATAEPLAGAVYLNCATLRNTTRVAAAFDAGSSDRITVRTLTVTLESAGSGEWNCRSLS